MDWSLVCVTTSRWFQIKLGLQEMDYSGAVHPDVSMNQLRIAEGRLLQFLQQSGIRSMTLNDTGNEAA